MAPNKKTPRRFAMNLRGVSTSDPGSFLAEWQSVGGTSRPPRETPGAPPKPSARDVTLQGYTILSDVVKRRCQFCRATLLRSLQRVVSLHGARTAERFNGAPCR